MAEKTSSSIKTHTLLCRVDEEMFERVLKHQKKVKVPISQIVRWALDEYLRKGTHGSV